MNRWLSGVEAILRVSEYNLAIDYISIFIGKIAEYKCQKKV